MRINTIEYAKDIILKQWNTLPKKDKPKSGQGIIAMKLSRHFFSPTKEQKKYKELYLWIVDLIK